MSSYRHQTEAELEQLLEQCQEAEKKEMLPPVGNTYLMLERIWKDLAIVRKQFNILWSFLNRDNLASGAFEVESLEKLNTIITELRAAYQIMDPDEQIQDSRNELLAIIKLLTELSVWTTGCAHLIQSFDETVINTIKYLPVEVTSPLNGLLDDENRTKQIQRGMELGKEAMTAARTISIRLQMKLEAKKNV